jgi:signal transduction histidine kinase
MSPPSLDALVGIAFCALALGNWRRAAKEPSLLMMATGALWLIGGPVGSLALAHRGPLLHLFIGYPRGRVRDRAERLTVVAGYLDAFVYPLGRSAVATIALAAWVCGIATLGYRRSRGARHRARLTSLLGSAMIFSVLAFGAASRLGGWHVEQGVVLAYEVSLIVVSAALFADVRWGRWQRAAVSMLAVDLGHSGAGRSLRDRLADAVGDPTLALGYVNPGSDRWVDDVGRTMELELAEPGRTLTPILENGRTIAVLAHDSSVLRDPAALDSVAALTRLALANVQLQADVEKRVIEVESSRRRLVNVADAERARLEAELHAGPLGRLEHIASLLTDLEIGTPELATQLSMSRRAIHDAASGLYPRVLLESGLRDAISQLATTAPVPVELDMPPERFGAEVEAAVYFVCAEALTNLAKYAHASRGWIRLTQGPGELVLEVDDDGVGGAQPSAGSGLTGLADRLDVLGGTLTVANSPTGGTRLSASIPLVSR